MTGTNVSSSVRWALVTLALGITTGVLGHYLPAEIAGFVVPFVSMAFAFIGASAGMKS